MAKYILAGGSGFVGTALSKLLLSEGHQVYILSTRPQISTHRNLQYILWNTQKGTIDSSFTCTQAKLINLAGASVAEKRWSQRRKAEILSSRVDSLNTIYQAVASGQLGITNLVSASAIGYYGEGNQPYHENSPADDSFLSSTCQQWEKAALTFEKLNIKVSIARIGIVMGKEGGALKELSRSLPFRIAGIPSNGEQVYSWIHLQDVCRLIYFLAENEKKGIFNAVAPEPVSLNRLMQAMINTQPGFVLKLHVPSFFLKVLMGEMAIEILKSSHVSSEKMETSGFIFRFKNIEACMNDLFNPGK